MIFPDSARHDAGNRPARVAWIAAHVTFAAGMVLLAAACGYVSLFVAACIQSDACPGADGTTVFAPFLLTLAGVACTATNAWFACGRPRRAGVIFIGAEVVVFALAVVVLPLFGL